MDALYVFAPVCHFHREGNRPDTRVMSVLKRSGRWAIGLGSMIAGLTAHGLVMLLVLAVLVLVLAVLGLRMMRWVISSEERSSRIVRMISAWRGNMQSPTTARPRALLRTGQSDASPRSGRDSGPASAE